MTTGRAGRRNCRVMGITRPVIRSDANNVLMMGPGDMMTLSANIPIMLIKMYCPSRPIMSDPSLLDTYHSIDDAVEIQ